MVKKAIFATQAEQLCPVCREGVLQIRQSRSGLFKRCSHFPDCDYRQPLRLTGQILQEIEGKSCPKCGATLLIRQHQYGLSISCSAYPTCDYQEKINSSIDTQVTCPSCHSGQLLQKQSRFGKTFYACNHYPTCRFVLNYVPLTGHCPHCGYPLLMQKNTPQGLAVYCANRVCGKKLTEQQATELL